MTKARIQAHSRGKAGAVEVTEVMGKRGTLAYLLVILAGIGLAHAQQPSTSKPQGPGESLYLKLRSVGLDKSRVYKIREASLDRASLHISFDDGTIGFTEDVEGHITGAFFTGFGEALLSPPNTTERSSLAFFTGAAILEEKFSTAYLRFNDHVFAQLQPSLRSPESPDEFVSEWNMTARNLADQDALRLLLTLADTAPQVKSDSQSSNDHFLHAFFQGSRLGTFDVRYDSLSPEQIAAGQHKRVEGEDYYDVWTSFTVHGAKGASGSGGDQEVETSTPVFDIIDVKIQAEVKPPTEINARAMVSITSHQSSTRVLLFELSRLLQVGEVRADGQPVEFIHNLAIEGSRLAKRGNDLIAVILPAAIHAGQKLELSFDYSGAVLSEAANGLLYVGERGTWYPNRGLTMASFEMEFHYPPGWTLVATGHRTHLETEGEQISRWVSERLVPVAGFNLGKYSQTVTHAGSVAITTYATRNVERSLQAAVAPEPAIPEFPKPPRIIDPTPMPSPSIPPSPSQNLQMVGSASARAVDFFERHFGPFPYSELSITQLPGSLSQGWPGLIFLASYAFLRPEDKEKLEPDSRRRLIFDEVIAHETAHQWWGDLVGWSGYRDQWIVEGLANYSALMLLESRDPEKFHRILQTYRDDLLAKNKKDVPLMTAGPVTLGMRLSSSQFPDAYQGISYGRGTWLFHMLRTMMRDAERKNTRAGAKQNTDEPFLRALRKVRTAYEGRPITTAELMAVFESELPPGLSYEGHKSLSWFYQGWVDGTAVPSFGLRSVKFTDKGTTTLATGTLVQDEAPEDLVTAVPIYASIGGKNVFAGHVFAEGHETLFHLAVPAGTRKLVADPERTLLARGK